MPSMVPVQSTLPVEASVRNTFINITEPEVPGSPCELKRTVTWPVGCYRSAGHTMFDIQADNVSTDADSSDGEDLADPSPASSRALTPPGLCRLRTASPCTSPWAHTELCPSDRANAPSPLSPCAWSAHSSPFFPRALEVTVEDVAATSCNIAPWAKDHQRWVDLVSEAGTPSSGCQDGTPLASCPHTPPNMCRLRTASPWSTPRDVAATLLISDAPEGQRARDNVSE